MSFACLRKLRVKSVETAFLSSTIYLALGALFYSIFEGWSVVDSVYFCIVTMSTVGYGDMSPSHDGSKLFTLVWIMIGICAVFVSIHSAVDDCVAPFMQRSRDLLERLFPQEPSSCASGDGTVEHKTPRHPVGPPHSYLILKPTYLPTYLPPT
jgi:hypothetical protein